MRFTRQAVAAILALNVSGVSIGADTIFRRPGVIRFGTTTQMLQKSLKPMCPTLRTRKIDPPFLANVRTEQLQIDCDGFMFRGKGRHIEFVIRDNRLVMVWLMVEPAEAASMIAAMTRAYGAPTSRNARYIAFQKQRSAWRHKPAEILFYAPSLDASLASDFE